VDSFNRALFVLASYNAGPNRIARLREQAKEQGLDGLITAAVPLLFGAAVGLGFGYGTITAIVVGALLASHTLLGSRVVAELGANRLEPVTVTVGATLLSDTLSLVLFAICVSTYESGFSNLGTCTATH
jgi:Kef-type K+ transport system membrane component KefB